LDTTAQIIKEFGLHFFKAVCQKDEEFTFKSETPNNELDIDSKSYFCVVTSGSFLSENENRDNMTFKPTKRRVADGMVLPGQNKFKALEDNSIYYCVSVLHARPSTKDFHTMYKLKHEYLEVGQVFTLRFEDNDLTLISLGITGEAVITDGANVTQTALEDGQRLMVPDNGSIVFTATTAGHIVVGKRKFMPAS